MTRLDRPTAPVTTQPEGRGTRRLLEYGPAALLLECDAGEVLGLARAIETRFSQIAEAVPGAETVLLTLRRPLPEAERRQLLTLRPEELPAEDRRSITIEVEYSGDDLADVARYTGLSVDEVIAAHTGQLWRVAFCGFAPGFSYLAGSDPRLVVPRRATPRTKVPNGSVALADRWSGIYPRTGPGGWQLIGRTRAKMWDLDRTPPALLRPGRTVRFVAVDAL